MLAGRRCSRGALHNGARSYELEATSSQLPATMGIADRSNRMYIQARFRVPGGSMVNGKMPLYLTALGLAGLGLGGLLWQPYTADWPGTAYAKPIRRYIHAAIRQDSSDLARVSASAAAVSWGLTAGRAHRASLARWERRMQAWTGERRGDT